MSFKDTKQFKSGNYNSWYSLATKVFPRLDQGIRSEILPFIDDILESMLGFSAEVEKTSVNIIPTLTEDNEIEGMMLSLEYTVKDFKVDAVPKEAVQEDEEAIKKSLEEKGYTVSTLTIDTETGLLSLKFNLNMADAGEQ